MNAVDPLSLAVEVVAVVPRGGGTDLLTVEVSALHATLGYLITWWSEASAWEATLRDRNTFLNVS